MTTHQPNAPFKEIGCFISYNSADAGVTRMVADAVGRLDRIKLDNWEYTEDANLGRRKYDSIDESIRGASSIAIFLGREGLGRIQEGQELDWALDAETEKRAHVFIVLLPDAKLDDLPAKLGNQARVPLLDEDVADGLLTPTGFAKLCGGIRALNREAAALWIKARERELFLTPPRRARALLVGICEYDDEELPNLTAPGRDVEELATTLRSLQLQGGVEWEVTSRPELARDELLEALENFYLRNVDPDDLLLFYFSGHGARNDDSAYFMPRDGSTARPATKGGVRADALREYLRNTAAWASIVVLDCCHGDAGGPDAGIYDDLPERSAVLGASAGLTEAEGEDGLSPFTSALISIMREQDPLNMTELGSRLKSYHPAAWAQLGVLGKVEKVTLGKTKHERATEPRRATERVVVGATPSTPAHLRLLRRLTQTLDALLAATPERTAEMEAVIRETLEVVVEELQGLAQQDAQSPSWARLNQMNPQPLVEVFLRGQDMREYASLPWEYLGVPVEGGLDWLPRSRICRVVPVPATKSAATGKMRSPLVLSSPPPEWGLGLKEVTRRETNWVKRDSFVASSHWGNLLKSKPDLLAIQCALGKSGEMAIERGWTIGFLKAGIDPKPVRTIVIETVADSSNPGAGLALRELAYATAQATSRSVIAVCHQTGYTNMLNDLVREDPGETTSEPHHSFLACLTNELVAGAKLEEAAYTARQNVVISLGPAAGPFVGVPVTVRAEPQATTNVSQKATPARTSQQSRPSAAPAADAESAPGAPPASQAEAEAVSSWHES